MLDSKGKLISIIGSLALLELPIDQRTVGPVPLQSITRQAGIAQLVEHDLAKVGVASLNLVSRSRIIKIL